MAELLRRNAQFELVEVEGHTDERALDEHNLRLSNDRANAVMQALVQRGIAPTRLVAAGYGEYCPLDPSHNARAWERNRRVQFLIVRTHDEGRTTAAAGCSRAAQYIPPTVGPPGSGVAREASRSGISSSAPPSGAPASGAPASGSPAPR
ncbi:MAG: OmpA family protein [Deltaproteobacteria bacterium]